MINVFLQKYTPSLSICYITTSLLFLTISAYAQTEGSGIYKTVQDFKTGNLSLKVDCKMKSHKIKLNDFFGKSDIIVVHEGKDYKFKKNDIYAYQLCGGEVYRFISNTLEYQILNLKETILIYKHETAPSKGNPKTTHYFFSKDADSTIQTLTLANLKGAFPTNHKFHDALDSNFKSDVDLAGYDSFHKMYKINHLLMDNN